LRAYLRDIDERETLLMSRLQKGGPPGGGDDAAQMAIEALGWLAGDDERLARFLAISGLGPQNLRQAAADPRFLAAILDYLASNEALLMDFARDAAHSPQDVAKAHAALCGPEAGAPH
jgi:hypothetical protein